MGKRTIPELRDAIRKLADQLDEQILVSPSAPNQLRQIADEMVRRSPARPKAPVIHKPLTGEERLRIQRFAFSEAGRKMHIADIAARFGTNPGRVSEALHGR